MRNPLLTIITILTSVTLNCRETSKTAAEMQLKISPLHMELFSAVEKSRYAGADIQTLLMRLDADGTDYCDAVSRRAKPTGNFLKTEIAIKDQAFDIATQTRLGCKTWYNLTDFDVHEDFIMSDQMKNTSGKKSYTCVSVGLLQPYIMSDLMHCKILYIADTNFRILKAHYEIIEAIKSGKFATIDEVIGSLEFRYATETATKDSRANSKLTIQEICGTAHEAQCRYFLVRFMQRFREIPRITLLLSSLEELPGLLDSSEPDKVSYVSNAIDPQFMPGENVKKYVAGVAAIGGSQVIYHQSGRSSFAIYEILPTGKIETNCADSFVSFVPGHYSPDRCKYYAAKSTRFVTYFDSVSQTQSPPTCNRR
jgi:hypothetical protein